MSGLGATDQYGFTIPETSTAGAATAAGTSIWDSIAKIGTSLLSTAPSLIQNSVTASLQKRVLDAQKSVLEAQGKADAAAIALVATKQAMVDAVTAPWYKNPIVIGGGLAVVGFAAWKAMTPKRRGRR